MATVIGVFERNDRARMAIEALQDEGFTEDELSIVARGESDDEGSDGYDEDQMTMDGENLADGAAWGGGLGALGGLLAGVGALAVPGIGPLVAAGPIAAALSGAVAGGIAGTLIDLGIPEGEGDRFEQDVREGRLLAVVETEGDAARRAEEILRRHGAEEVKTYQ